MVRQYARAVKHRRREAGTRATLNHDLHLDQKTCLADDIMVNADRRSMASSLETRASLLDTQRVIRRDSSVIRPVLIFSRLLLFGSERSRTIFWALFSRRGSSTQTFRSGRMVSRTTTSEAPDQESFPSLPLRSR